VRRRLLVIAALWADPRPSKQSGFIFRGRRLARRIITLDRQRSASAALFPPPAFCECRHRGLARRLVWSSLKLDASIGQITHLLKNDQQFFPFIPFEGMRTTVCESMSRKVKA
jgi:hypothetical protein